MSWKRLISAVAGVALLGTALGCSGNASLREDNRRLEEQVKQLSAEIEKVKALNETQAKQLQHLNLALQSLEKTTRAQYEAMRDMFRELSGPMRLKENLDQPKKDSGADTRKERL